MKKLLDFPPETPGLVLQYLVRTEIQMENTISLTEYKWLPWFFPYLSTYMTTLPQAELLYRINPIVSEMKLV